MTARTTDRIAVALVAPLWLVACVLAGMFVGAICGFHAGVEDLKREWAP